MDTDYEQQLRELELSMEEAARPGFDASDIEDLGILIRLTVDFHHYLEAKAPWPQFPEDPAHDREYKIDSIFFNVDSFRRVMHAYCILDGAIRSTRQWDTLGVGSLKDEFARTYDAFLRETVFEPKCRLLLDLMKMQIMFAGAFYDCMPNEQQHSQDVS